MNLRSVAAPAVLALALSGAVAAPALAQDDPTPPSVAQVCAATGVDQVDALLDGVASTDLVGSLEPLASLTVPDADRLTLRADVDLDDVRTALDCEPAPTTEPPATDEPTTEPPATDTPSTEPPADTGLPVFYGDCADARAAGAAPITVGQDGYRSGLDADNDGIACEDDDSGSGGGGVDTGSGVGPSLTPSGGVDTGAL